MMIVGNLYSYNEYRSVCNDHSNTLRLGYIEAEEPFVILEKGPIKELPIWKFGECYNKKFYFIKVLTIKGLIGWIMIQNPEKMTKLSDKDFDFQNNLC